MFASYQQQVSGTSYGKLLVKVINCCNNLQEQRASFLQARCKITEEVTVQLVTGKRHKYNQLQQVTASYMDRVRLLNNEDHISRYF